MNYEVSLPVRNDVLMLSMTGGNAEDTQVTQVGTAFACSPGGRCAFSKPLTINSQVVVNVRHWKGLWGLGSVSQGNSTSEASPRVMFRLSPEDTGTQAESGGSSGCSARLER